MPETWDCLVVGAGVGGLVAAARLRREGLRVLVLERKGAVGGTAGVFARGGCTFPMGPLGFAHPGLVGGTVARLADGPLPSFSRVRYRLLADGIDVELSLPPGRLEEELAHRFPADAGGIRIFMGELRRASSPGAGDLALTPASTRLGELVRAPALRRLLGSIGAAEPSGTMALLAAMWRLMGEGGIWHPDDGLRALWRRLADAVTAPGPGAGAIRTGADVAAIIVGGGRAAGATLATGEVVGAEVVISNADYPATFLGLVPPEAIPGGWREAVARSPLTGSVIQVALGIEASLADLSAFDSADRVIYRRDDPGPPPDWRSPAVAPEALAGEELEISLWPTRSAGTARPVVVLRVAADHAHFTRFRLGRFRRATGYAAYKERLARALVAAAESVVPGLGGAVRVTDVATPLTVEDYGGRTAGAVAGWSWEAADARGATSGSLVRTPVRGLYMAGHQAASALFAGGVPTAVATGLEAAEAALEGAEPATRWNGPGPSR